MALPPLGSSPPSSPLVSSSASPAQASLQRRSAERLQTDERTPDEYAHIVRSLQRRSAERLAADGHEQRTKTRGGGGVSQDLEADLRLAAELGQALLRDKTQLQQRLDAAEKGQQKLLDRLTSSVKENAQLQRRLEETVGSLEQADASNRALLVSLEEDRKTISRLSVDSGKLVATSSTLKQLQRSHEDTVHELSVERKRADAAELKNRKLGERTAELEVRLKKALEDLEELRQDKVLRTRRSNDAMAQLRARYARGETLAAAKEAAISGVDDVNENTEAKELLKMVETLVSENSLLRSESIELHGLLEMSREEQADLRSAIAAQEIFPEEQEDQLGDSYGDSRRNRQPSVTSTFPAPHLPPSDSILSPSVSQTLTDYDFSRRPGSPSSTHATSFNRSWAPSASLSHSHRAIDLSRTFSGSSFGSEEQAAVVQQFAAAGFDPRTKRAASRKRPPPVQSASTGTLTGGKVPVGRGHSRRAMSMDVTSAIRGNPLSTHDFTSAPTSPHLDYPPSSSRPPSIFSTTSEDPEPSSRPRRHHRPLSLSLGPSLFPQVPEDDDQEKDRPISPFTRQPSHRRRPSQATLASPAAGLGVTSLSLSGIVRRPRASHSPERPAIITVDSSTQTIPPATPAQPPRLFHPSASTPERASLSSFSRSPSPSRAAARSSTSVSEHYYDRDLSTSPGGGSSGAGEPHPSVSTGAEQRTAALAQLIEHAAKLLSRVQSADIATQEKRLKKQNLPGDVRHLAQANLRDLATDIEAVRHHFRRIVELERAAQAKDAAHGTTLAANPNDSLVTRRDFVSLVKLLRDLLHETARLRSIVNRVQLDPALASTLKELDIPTALEPEQPVDGKTSATAGGLLAPLTRLFGATLSPDEPTLSHRSSSAQLRPPAPKRGGSSTVSMATVNVEFGGGGVRQSSNATAAPSASSSQPKRPPPTALRAGAAPAQVKRDISSIFAGAPTRSASASVDPWVVVPSSSTTSASSSGPATRIASAASSYIPFGRLLSSYRPALSSTTNAVLDSLPHAPRSSHPSSSHRPSTSALSDNEEDDDAGPAPTLLERQLRPRGLSDSSIRNSFLAHGAGPARANPHHRLIWPASLALSSEPTRVDPTASVLSSSPSAASPSLSTASGAGKDGLAAIDALRTTLSTDGGTVSRRPSAANLRAKASSSRLRESSLPAAPFLASADQLPPLLPAIPKDILSTSVPSTTTTDSTLVVASPSSSSSAAAPILIAPPSPRGKVVTTDGAAAEDEAATTTGGAAGIFGTMVSSAWGSLAASAVPVATGGEGGRKGKREKGVGGESWKDSPRFGRPPVAQEGSQGSLRGIVSLPAELVALVASSLDLPTLFHLSRLNKCFYLFLRDPQIEYVWEAARETSGLPTLTAPGMDTVGLANLLFGCCMGCEKATTKVDYVLRIRSCKGCSSDFILDECQSASATSYVRPNYERLALQSTRQGTHNRNHIEYALASLEFLEDVCTLYEESGFVEEDAIATRHAREQVPYEDTLEIRSAGDWAEFETLRRDLQEKGKADGEELTAWVLEREAENKQAKEDIRTSRRLKLQEHLMDDGWQAYHFDSDAFKTHSLAFLLGIEADNNQAHLAKETERQRELIFTQCRELAEDRDRAKAGGLYPLNKKDELLALPSLDLQSVMKASKQKLFDRLLIVRAEFDQRNGAQYTVDENNMLLALGVRLSANSGFDVSVALVEAAIAIVEKTNKPLAVPAAEIEAFERGFSCVKNGCRHVKSLALPWNRIVQYITCYPHREYSHRDDDEVSTTDIILEDHQAVCERLYRKYLKDDAYANKRGDVV
ncbi:hypothetical protein JCM8547_007236 [Rhodosporidiobolus lusitaniae]